MVNGQTACDRRIRACSVSSSTRTVACRSTRRMSSASTAASVVLRCLRIFSPSPTTHTATCLSVRRFIQ